MVKAFENLVENIQLKLQAVFLKKADRNPDRRAMTEATKIPWSWIAVNVAEILSAYPTGLTDTVLLSILELEWEKSFLKKFKGFDKNFSSIQAVYDSNISEKHLLEITVKTWETIQNTKNYILFCTHYATNVSTPKNDHYSLTLSIHQITTVDESGPREMDIYMHPKFNNWIAYQHNQQFFKNRKIRMICPPKANAPIINRYKDLSLDRRHRVALIPPTEDLVIMLNRLDKSFVLREFPNKIRHIKNTDDTYKLWLKIIHVEQVSHISTANNVTSGGKKQSRTDVYLIDMSSECSKVILSFYDNQSSLLSIFRRNDYIGLADPSIRSIARGEGQEALFDYSSDSVIFLMPEKEAQEAGLAKTNLTSMIEEEEDDISIPDPTKKDIAERDEEDFVNSSNYLSRIMIKDLSHRMLNVTLYGKVVGLADNNPFSKPNETSKPMDRFALRVVDATGTMDITLWETVGRSTRKLKIGQYVLIDQLVTSDKHERKNKRVWYVNGSAICGTKIYNISELSGLLSSPSFRSIIPLWHAKEIRSDHFQIEGTIIGWELHLNSNNDEQFVLSDVYSSSQISNAASNDVDFLDLSVGERITTLAHAECLLPHKSKNQIKCDFCGCQIGNDVVQIFRPKPGATDRSGRDWEGWIEWRLDDGTSTCKIYGGEETLMNITAHHFKLMSHKSQITLLDSVIGLPILCSLSGSSTSTTYRLDQMTLLEPTQQECRDMLEVLDKK